MAPPLPEGETCRGSQAPLETARRVQVARTLTRLAVGWMTPEGSQTRWDAAGFSDSLAYTHAVTHFGMMGITAETNIIGVRAAFSGAHAAISEASGEATLGKHSLHMVPPMPGVREA